MGMRGRAVSGTTGLRKIAECPQKDPIQGLVESAITIENIERHDAKWGVNHGKYTIVMKFGHLSTKITS